MHAKLDAAIKSIQKGNDTAAANQLRAFINEIEAMRQSGRLSAAAAQELISEANAIIGQI